MSILRLKSETGAYLSFESHFAGDASRKDSLMATSATKTALELCQSVSAQSLFVSDAGDDLRGALKTLKQSAYDCATDGGTEQGWYGFVRLGKAAWSFRTDKTSSRTVHSGRWFDIGAGIYVSTYHTQMFDANGILVDTASEVCIEKLDEHGDPYPGSKGSLLINIAQGELSTY